ncbi:helix-turn-helix domain-containing protein [Blastococcus montanus]|uniref:TetR/AcrR family transcriptional regulator n=1 Tax=Blastococcus montanus TaxID=3144973 RepID=UPI00320B2F24
MTDAPDWRTRRWEATHRRILEAALELFQQHGYERVSVAQVAQAAGVSVPTFYAHYPSKEHVLMRLPDAEATAALLSGQPDDLPLGQRIRRAILGALTGTGAEDRSEMYARWRIIATTPTLRHRPAEFERTAAAMVLEALAGPGRPVRPADTVVAGAYLSALTTGMLTWADGEGRRPPEECVQEAFDALHHT